MKLSKKAVEARREYFRNWRKRNPEKVKQHMQRYWERKAKDLNKNSENNGDR